MYDLGRGLLFNRDLGRPWRLPKPSSAQLLNDLVVLRLQELLNRNYATFTIDSGLRGGLRDLDSRLSNGKWHLEEVDFGARTVLLKYLQATVIP
ncbi:hypothetical protein K0M31_000490, partial [Melipona bicolor]